MTLMQRVVTLKHMELHVWVWLSRAAMMSWQRLLEMQNSERLDSLSWVGDFIDFQFLSNFVIPSC